MEFKSIEENITTLLKRVPCVSAKQLEVFFGIDERSLRLVRIFIKKEIQHQVISERTLSDGTVYLTSRRGFNLGEDTVKETLECFWPIANMGMENVELVHTGESLIRFVWYRKRENMEQDLLCYDVTWCPTVSYAVAGFNLRQALGEHTHEMYQHLALVPGPAEGEGMKEQLSRLGYSHYAYKTEDDHITYVPLSPAHSLENDEA